MVSDWSLAGLFAFQTATDNLLVQSYQALAIEGDQVLLQSDDWIWNQASYRIQVKTAIQGYQVMTKTEIELVRLDQIRCFAVVQGDIEPDCNWDQNSLRWLP